MRENRQTCFVDMPFGDKQDPHSGETIHFDAIFARAIAPAIAEVGLECVRRDQGRMGGVIHSAMFARLLLSDVAIADMTLAHPNVFYELGVRHCARPRATIPIFSGSAPMPFDVGPVRAVHYTLEKGVLTDDGAAALKGALVSRLGEALDRTPVPDSPLFEFIKGFKGIELSHEVTDVFRDTVKYAEKWRDRLEAARTGCAADEGRKQLRAVEAELGDLHRLEHGVLIDLYLSYRDVEGWDEMISLFDRFPPVLQGSVLARQQLALALNRRAGPGDRKKATAVLTKLIEQRGGDAETYGILGRIYKDRFKAAKKTGSAEAAVYLDEAIDAYARGFEREPLDYYPGVNAVNLLVQKGTEDALARAEKLVPLVTFAAVRRGGVDSKDYWDVATVFELACIGGDLPLAEQAMTRAVTLAAAPWMIKTTADNLKLLIAALEKRGDAVDALAAMHRFLEAEAAAKTAGEM